MAALLCPGRVEDAEPSAGSTQALSSALLAVNTAFNCQSKSSHRESCSQYRWSMEQPSGEPHCSVFLVIKKIMKSYIRLTPPASGDVRNRFHKNLPLCDERLSNNALHQDSAALPDSGVA